MGRSRKLYIQFTNGNLGLSHDTVKANKGQKKGRGNLHNPSEEGGPTYFKRLLLLLVDETGSFLL